MDNINIEVGERSPKITCDWDKGVMEIVGESYPENVTDFYGPVLSAVEKYLSASKDKSFSCTFELLYFNSSSAKVLMRIFDMFEEYSNSHGHNIKLFGRLTKKMIT